MVHILLTDPKGFKKLVNMALVSEALPMSGPGTGTNLVVPSAADETNRLIVVSETPEDIDLLLRKHLAGIRPVSRG